jgi:hypothetical protein
MKLVMSTTLAAGVLTLLVTGLAEAENKNCTNVVKECRAAVPIPWFGTYACNAQSRDPLGRYYRVSECVRARGCVPQYPPRPL